MVTLLLPGHQKVTCSSPEIIKVGGHSSAMKCSRRKEGCCLTEPLHGTLTAQPGQSSNDIHQLHQAPVRAARRRRASEPPRMANSASAESLNPPEPSFRGNSRASRRKFKRDRHASLRNSNTGYCCLWQSEAFKINNGIIGQKAPDQVGRPSKKNQQFACWRISRKIPYSLWRESRQPWTRYIAVMYQSTYQERITQGDRSSWWQLLKVPLNLQDGILLNPGDKLGLRKLADNPQP
eukprot:SM000008S22310  [mRNA]  locus=s8:930142:939049:- [translate_table: standard]